MAKSEGKVLDEIDDLSKQDSERKEKIKKFWKDGYDPDPTFSIWGSGKISHPELWKKITDNLTSNGCKIKIGEANLTYGPSAIKGEPGVLSLTNDASITALKHEAKHFFDDLAKGFPSNSYYMQNPFANSPLSKNGSDVRDNFFGESRIETYNNFQIIIDPSSDINPKDEIKILTHTFYRDKNHNNIQDSGEYDIKVKLFITNIKEQLDEIYNDTTIKPDPREILLFLEDNRDDFSGATLYIKKGNLVDNELSNFLAKSKAFSDYINTEYNISISDIKALLLTGKVQHPIKDILGTFVEISAFFLTNPIIFKEIGSSIKKAVDFIKENCTIDEQKWNPKKATQSGSFEPFLFSGVNQTLDNIDDKAINDYLKNAIKNLKSEIKTYDNSVLEALNSITKVPIPILIPFIPVPVPSKIPDSFSEVIWEKYKVLRQTMDSILQDIENIDFSNFAKQSFTILNAFLCGIWDGFIEAICGIISLIQYLFQGAEYLIDFLKNFKTQGPDLIEKIDDIIAKFQNLDFGKIFTTLATNLKEWIQSDSSVTLVEIAYFSGMFIGIVVELVIEIVVGIVFTGGTLSIEAVVAKLGETFKALSNLLIGAIKLPAKVVNKTISAFYKALNWVYEFLAKGTDEILKILDEVFAMLKEVVSVFSKSTLETYERLGIEVKKVPKSPVLGSGGGAIKPLLEEGKYALIKDGKEIFRGTKKEVDEIAEKLKGMSDEAAEKYLDDLAELSIHKIVTNYISKLKPLVLNENLPRQIAEATNNFKRYLVRLEEGFLKTKNVLFDSKGEYIDWIITSENELLFGHGHAFLSKHSKNIKNAGTSIIENGKIIKISNGSGHYTPMPEYLDVIIPYFEEIKILDKEYKILKWKPKKR